MTVVEFFACSPLENMISCFSLRPDKVIFIGDGRRMRQRVAAYEKLAVRLGINAVFEYRTVNHNSVNKICNALIEIVETEKDCCFDLTGGSELALVAMGRVFQMYQEDRHLQMQRFNIATGKIKDCDDDGEVVASHISVALTGSECIELHRGRVIQSTTASSIKDAVGISDLWDIAKRKPTVWNMSINCLSEFLAVSHHENGGKRAVIDKVRISSLPDFKERFESVKDFLSLLNEKGLVCGIKETADEYSFAYKNSTIKKCLSKVGNVLELKTLLLADSIYNGCISGVVIDWDGVKEETGFEGSVNEIDLLMMRGFTPIFVSCKNGSVDDYELYKLSAVAERFGGKYAKKVLLLSELKKRGVARRYFLQRADDMGIKVIEGVNKLSDNAFATQLAKI